MFSSHVHDTDKLRRELFDKLVDKRVRQLERIATKKRKQGLRYFRIKATECSQCKRGMETKIAKLQIENKRENAPICVACITGVKRKPLRQFKK